MQNYIRYVVALLPLLCSASLFAQSLNVEKIDPILLDQLEAQPKDFHEVILLLNDQVDVLAEAQLMSKNGLSLHERRVRLVQLLEKKAEDTQADLLAQLSQLKTVEKGSVQPYWITNMIHIRANLEAIAVLSQSPDIYLIEALPEFKAFNHSTIVEAAPTVAPGNAEENLSVIKADELWAMGYTGYGTKVLVIDSGQDQMHPALRGGFLGNATPLREAWAGTEQPEDCGVFHGTHVLGVVAGLDRITNDTIGVAYNTQWLGGPTQLDDCELVQNIRSSVGNLQWALNPDGNSNTTGDIPDVVNNSWGNDGGCNEFFTNILNSLEAAGIAVVWAAGNSGPDSSTISGQASLNSSLISAFSVGSVSTNNLRITSFSSRGPSGCGGSDGLEIKPEVVAPGEQIRSASDNGGYVQLNGTSFAAPHVSGAILLLKEAFPELGGVDFLTALYRTARDLGAAGEDNVYGNGLIDVRAAYDYLIDQGFSPTPPVSTANDVVLVNVFSEKNIFCLNEVNNVLAVENNGNSNLRSLTIDYFITGAASRVDRVEWTGNVAYDEVAQINLPTLTDLPPGDYELVVDIYSPNGRPDMRSQNNRIRHTFRVADVEAISANLSATYETAICRDANVLLESEVTLDDNQTVRWYSLPFGGEAIGEGDRVATPAISELETYYADIISTYSAGKIGVEENERTSYAIDDAGLLFDAAQDFTLKTVKVFAEERGKRIIKLSDQQGNLIKQEIITIEAGESRIELNMFVPAGEGYQLLLSAGNSLLHSNSNVDYPYEIDDVVTIQSSAEPETNFRYFFFYDWEIEANHPCGRTAVVVRPTTTQSAELVTIEASETDVMPNETINFQAQANGAETYEWNFGDGNTSSDANPTYSFSEAGIYTVSLIATSRNGCASSATMTITVDEDIDTSVETLLNSDDLMIYPNPTSDRLTIELEEAVAVSWVLFDALGRQLRVQNTPTVEQRFELDLTNLPDGIYYLSVQVGEQQYVEKVLLSR